MPIFGNLTKNKTGVVFHGRKNFAEDDATDNIGLFICDEVFTGGEVTVEVMFKDVCDRSSADIVLHFDPTTKDTVNAGLTSVNLFSIRHFSGQWTNHASSGDSKQIEPNRSYKLKVLMNGSLVSLYVDGVEVLKTNLPYAVPQSQIGVFSVNEGDVVFNNFKITQSLCCDAV